jgi:hypothetical protein
MENPETLAPSPPALSRGGEKGEGRRFIRLQ